MISTRPLIVFLMLVSIIATGCQSTGAEQTSPAVDALVAYLNALNIKDEATLSSLSCAEWEAMALLELDAFQSVETRLEGLSCQQDGADDGAVTVICQGEIIASYFGEDQEFDLSERTYTMVEQNGDWLVCGY